MWNSKNSSESVNYATFQGRHLTFRSRTQSQKIFPNIHIFTEIFCKFLANSLFFILPLPPSASSRQLNALNSVTQFSFFPKMLLKIFIGCASVLSTLLDQTVLNCAGPGFWGTVLDCARNLGHCASTVTVPAQCAGPDCARYWFTTS